MGKGMRLKQDHTSKCRITKNGKYWGGNSKCVAGYLILPRGQRTFLWKNNCYSLVFFTTLQLTKHRVNNYNLSTVLWWTLGCTCRDTLKILILWPCLAEILNPKGQREQGMRMKRGKRQEESEGAAGGSPRPLLHSPTQTSFIFYYSRPRVNDTIIQKQLNVGWKQSA